MMIDMQEIITFLLVTIAALAVGRSFLRQFREDADGCRGCGSCPAAAQDVAGKKE